MKDFSDPNSKGARAFTEQWSKFKPSLHGSEHQTGFDVKLLREFAETSVSYPVDFAVHARIKKYHIDDRIKSLNQDKLSWATC
jgi:2-oxoglutarate dehydrogenase complex dehydrogenase (E1) component-like enzyme